jgi:hypothetical protein
MSGGESSASSRSPNGGAGSFSPAVLAYLTEIFDNTTNINNANNNAHESSTTTTKDNCGNGNCNGKSNRRSSSTSNSTRNRNRNQAAAAEAFIHATQGGEPDPDTADTAATDTDNDPLLLLLQQRDSLDLREFLVHMASGAADALAPCRPRESDFSRPLADYFVNSSHNTYITGNQLTSKASVEPYRNVCASKFHYFSLCNSELSFHALVSK